MTTGTDQLARCMQETFLDQITLEGTVLSEALSLDGEAITTLPDRKLSAMIYNLSRYQVYLQLHANVRTAHLRDAKREFDNAMREALVKIKAGSKSTIKEKEALAISGNPELKLLEEKMAAAEREDILFRRVPEQTEHLVNSLKKELGRREGP